MLAHALFQTSKTANFVLELQELRTKNVDLVTIFASVYAESLHEIDVSENLSCWNYGRKVLQDFLFVRFCQVVLRSKRKGRSLIDLALSLRDLSRCFRGSLLRRRSARTQTPSHAVQH